MSSKPYLLIVEDSKDILDLVLRFYRAEGYETVAARDGKEALDLLRSRPDLPAVILLDLMMPVMDGLRFREAQTADARLAAVPVVIMTADANAAEKAAEAGVRGYIRKPVELQVLLAVAQKFVSPQTV